MKKRRRLAGKSLMFLMLVFFYLPIVYMIIFSFNDGKSLTSFTGFSLRWYKKMLESREMMEALYTTFSVALFATFISTFAGTIAAIGLSKSKKIVSMLPSFWYLFRNIDIIFYSSKKILDRLYETQAYNIVLLVSRYISLQCILFSCNFT